MERLELVRQALRDIGCKVWCEKDQAHTTPMKKKQKWYDKPKWDDIWGKDSKFNPTAKNIADELEYIEDKYTDFVHKEKLLKVNKIYEDLLHIRNSDVNKMVYWDYGKERIVNLKVLKKVKGVKDVYKILADKFEKLRRDVVAITRDRMKKISARKFKHDYDGGKISLGEWQLAKCTKRWLNDKLKDMGGKRKKKNKLRGLDLMNRLKYVLTLEHSSACEDHRDEGYEKDPDIEELLNCSVFNERTIRRILLKV